MKTTIKRLLSLAMTVLMLLSLLPAANAADAGTAAAAFRANGSTTATYYSTLMDALTASNTAGGGTIDLLQDGAITGTRFEMTGDGHDLTLNLNGYTVTAAKGAFRLGKTSGVDDASAISLTINGGGGTITWSTVSTNNASCFELYAGGGAVLTLNDLSLVTGTATVSGARQAIYVSARTATADQVVNLTAVDVIDQGGLSRPLINCAAASSAGGVMKSSVINIAGGSLVSTNNKELVTATAATNTAVNFLNTATVMEHVSANAFSANASVTCPAGHELATAAVDGGYRTTMVPAALDALSQRQELIVQTALAYYNQNPYIQYDGRRITKTGTTDRKIERHMDGGAPEDAAVDSQVYSVCSNFVYKCYQNAFDYKILGLNYAQTRMWATLPADNPIVVYKYKGEGGETDVNKALTESRALLQTGDIIVGYGSSGHAMLYVGDCLGNGGEYVLHCWGASYTIDSGEDPVESTGSIKLQTVDECCYTTGTSPNWYLGKDSNTSEGFTILRPLQDASFPTEPTAVGAARLQYPGLKITRELDRTKFDSARPGEEIPVTVTIENCGRQPLTGIVVEEYLPAGQTLVEGSVTAGAGISAGTIRWTADLAVGQSRAFTYKVKLSGSLGETIVFPHGSVAGIPSRETSLVLGGETLTDAQYDGLLEKGQAMAAAGTGAAFEDLDFFNRFYEENLGLEIGLPETTAQLLEKLTTADSGYLYRKDAVAAADEYLDRMILPLHFAGQYVYLDGSNWSRVREYNEAFYQPGDLFVCMDGGSMTEVVDPADLDLCVYLGGGKVLQYTTDGAQVATFANSLAKALHYNVVITLRPTLAYENLNTAYHTVTVAETENGTVSASATGSVVNGTGVTVAVTADQGYRLRALTLNGKTVSVNGGSYTFAVSQDVTVAAAFEQIPQGEAANAVAVFRASQDAQPVYYATLMEALTAANTAGGGTVDLLQDGTITGTRFSFTGRDMAVTLNLNGYDITAAKGGFRVGVTGTADAQTAISLTVNGGGGTITWATADSTNASCFEVYAGGGGTLTLNDLDIVTGTGTITGNRQAIYVSTVTAGANQAVSLTNVNIRDNVYGARPLISASPTVQAGSIAINISGGTFVSHGEIVRATATANAAVTFLDAAATMTHGAADAVSANALVVCPAGYALVTAENAGQYSTCLSLQAA